MSGDIKALQEKRRQNRMPLLGGHEQKTYKKLLLMWIQGDNHQTAHYLQETTGKVFSNFLPSSFLNNFEFIKDYIKREKCVFYREKNGRLGLF